LQIVVADGVIREDTCYFRTRHLPHIEAFRLDSIEHLFLKLFRHLCASLANDARDGWEAALMDAEQGIGEPDGSALVHDIVPLLHAIRDERSGCFSFMPADCAICSNRLSEEEHLTLDLVRAARKGDEAELLQRARALAGSSGVSRLACAARVLGEYLNMYALCAELQRSVRIPGRSESGNSGR
jgi:hypothetical protein